jgi:hypothetical protein
MEIYCTKNAGIWMLVILWTGAFTQQAIAQSDIPKMEIGAHYTALRYGEYDRMDTGGGGRVTVNIHWNLALEGELNFFPERHLFDGILNSRRMQGIFGAKAGWRSHRFGVFAKVRPGFIRLSERQYDPRIVFIQAPQPLKDLTNFALDTGGVLEFYPARAMVLRFDLGNTYVRDGSTSG